MRRYNPEKPPIPDEWLSLDEGERIQLVEAFHRKAREELPNHRLHAAFHVTVENQIALGHPPVVRAMDRLHAEGLSRHESLHAIASVLAEQFYGIMSDPSTAAAAEHQANYDGAVERLTAAKWRESRPK